MTNDQIRELLAKAHSEISEQRDCLKAYKAKLKSILTDIDSDIEQAGVILSEIEEAWNEREQLLPDGMALAKALDELNLERKEGA